MTSSPPFATFAHFVRATQCPTPPASAPLLRRAPRLAQEPQAYPSIGNSSGRPPAASLLHQLEGEMRDRAQHREYEQADALRAGISALEHARLPQAVEADNGLNADVVWYDPCLTTVLCVRDSRTIGLFHHGRSDDPICRPPWATPADSVGLVADPAHVDRMSLGVESYSMLRAPRGKRQEKHLHLCRINNVY